MIETLKDVDEERRCFRLVGGVLVERTVKDVLPALVNNKEQVNIFIYVPVNRRPMYYIIFIALCKEV